MTRKLSDRLSKSKILRYGNCPLGFYLDQQPEHVRVEPEEGSPLKIGLDVHELFEWYYKQPEAAKITQPYSEAMYKIFQKNPLAIQYMDFIDNFIDWNLEMIADRGVPGYMPVDVEAKIYDKDLDFVGIIDVVFETEEGLVIIDYKTSKRPKSFRENRLELLLYKILYEKATGKKVKYVGIFYPATKAIRMGKILDPGEEAPPKMPTLNLDDEFWALAKLDDTRERIDLGQFPKNPGFLCDYCDHQGFVCDSVDTRDM